MANLWLGIALEKPDPDQAEDHLLTAIDTDPHLTRAYLVLSNLYERSGRDDESGALLARSVESNPRDDVLLARLAHHHLRLGDARQHP